jgi:hypothetical protein
MKTWKKLDWGDLCPHCGGDAEALTECEAPNMAENNDTTRCLECNCPGAISLYEGAAWIQWEEEWKKE